MPDNTYRILFVINKGSGRKEFDWYHTIKEFFEKTGHQQAYFMMPVDDSIDKLKVKIGNFKPHRVIAVGGDGTVALVAKLVMGHDISMGILPAGSANGMAKELGIPEDPLKAMEIILSGVEKATDVIAINKDRICLHLSDIGINAQLIKYFEEGNTRGKIGYGLALIKAIWHRRRMNVWMKSKTAEIACNAVMVLIANASKYGTGATINPVGSIYDGLFEVVIVKNLNITEVLKMFRKIQRFNPKKIEIFQASSVRIETLHRVHFQVDGEYLGKVTKVEATVLPGKLKLIVPAG